METRQDRESQPGPEYPIKGIEQRYFLFVHYGLKKGEDWDFRRTLEIKHDVVLSKLTKDLGYLQKILDSAKDSFQRRWSGFAFVFLDPGWTDLLRARDTTARDTPLNLVALGAALGDMANDIKTDLTQNLPGWDRQFRIITAKDLISLLQLLEGQHPDRAKTDYAKWLTGGGDSLRYDGAKVVEAAIRIANIGRQVPILRFDDDVIFYGCRATGVDLPKKARQTQENILNICTRYHDLSADPQINYFIMSGGYLPFDQSEEIHLDKEIKTGDPLQLINEFATRVVQLSKLPTGPVGRNDPVQIDARIVSHFLRQICKYGANPFRQVVSGAGLCLSDSAILDLPPFSNMQQNVMWIDDHLKYALHHELGHFGKRKRTRHTARLRNVWFNQLRHDKPPTYENVAWHLKVYMTRLILGCVADSWLRKCPELKEDLRGLSNLDYKGILKKTPGAYAESFLKAVPGGMDSTARQKIARDLWKLANDRLSSLVRAWEADDGVYKDTFLGLYCQGESHDRHKDFYCDDESKSYIPSHMKEGLAAVVGKLPPEYPVAVADALMRTPPTDVNDVDLQTGLCLLVEDFVEYFEFVLFWKNFVQAVRFMLNQEKIVWMFPPDL